jgi:hypothetical protein
MRATRLPKSFPVGAVYVVEGAGGDQGRLSVSARYVLMPGGKRIDIPGQPREAAAGPGRQRLRLVSSGRPASRPKRFSRRLKKFVAAVGTPAQAAR